MADRELQFRSRDVEERSVHCFSDRQGCKMAVATEPKVEPCHRKGHLCHRSSQSGESQKVLKYSIWNTDSQLSPSTSRLKQRITSAHFLETVREMRRTKWRCWM
ncbi:hypothetical protein CDAR_622311 [Caerostris darwini]|uniref:Uncharacterized protein n=1 Tax=Caerostris darwini TaxID=1538125 RepID=A0AAV4QDF8_9ARAC|nr:hypothetical protein CDAR_622311 [Caerostris darwini]